jgi:hypothetical protein
MILLRKQNILMIEDHYYQLTLLLSIKEEKVFQRIY